MYYPYFRGKQNELLVIKETAQLMADRGFVPIIEPVKSSLGTLDRALRSITTAGGRAIVVVNPYHGDHAKDGSGIVSFLEKEFPHDSGIHLGVLLNQSLSVDQAHSIYKLYKGYNPAIIHAGFANPQGLASKIGDSVNNLQHIFFEKHCGSLYRKHFRSENRVLIRDGFEVQNNADYAQEEIFSDLHLTYKEEGFDGFGDFLIVSDLYKEKGGPAYAVAIHITYINDNEENVMYIYHFVSDTKDTPTDPGKKFIEALTKLVNKANSSGSMIYEGEAMKEFRKLHKAAHYPGLGSVKKLSMKHHIETLADFFS